MRQYSLSMGIIANRVLGVLLFLFVGAVHGASNSNQPDSNQPDFAWYREESARAVAAQALGPVDVGPVKLNGAELSADIAVRDSGESKVGQVNFILTLPTGEITSASLTDISLDSDSNQTDTQLAYLADQPAVVKDLGYIRGNRIVRVQIPLVIPGTSGQKLRRGIIRIKFISAPVIESPTLPTNANLVNDPIQRMLARFVANPADITRFAAPLQNIPQPVDSNFGPAIGGYPDAVARFRMSEAGVVQFSGADLAKCGVDLDTVSVTSVSVWAEGHPISVLPLGFNGVPRSVLLDDKFLVYTTDVGSTYTLTTDCWVRLNAEGAQYFDLSVSRENSFPDTGVAPSHFMAKRTFERDNSPALTKNDQFLTILGYRWVWWTWTSSTNADVPQPRDYNTSSSVVFSLDGLSTHSESAQLGLHFYAHHWTSTSRPISFNVSLNEKEIGKVTVSEPSDLEHFLKVDSSMLSNAGNRLVLTPQTTSTLDLPELCFDKLDVIYPRSYQMTSDTLEFTAPETGAAPVSLTWDFPTTRVLVLDITTSVPKVIGSKGTFPNTKHIYVEPGKRYLALAQLYIPTVNLESTGHDHTLRLPENVADLIVIAWPEFIDEMQPWIQRKQEQGHAVKIIDINRIYDEFGYGNGSPFAIRAFIRYSATHWQGSAKGAAASTVLLVGDSTSAYRNEFKNDVINYVPTMRRTDVSDPFASDQWFVNMFGSDSFADSLIGRFSVNNRDDLRNIIIKQLSYETGSAPGAWQNTLGFIADHSEFDDSVERVIKRAIPPRFFLDKIQMSNLPWIDNYYFPKKIADEREAKVSPEATGRIREMFDEGAAVVTYFGHGSPNIWSTERMWFGGDSPNSDNLLLTNRDKLSIVINMTCNSGAIDYPQPRWNVCISEDFMRVPNGGAVACFVPSGPGLTLQHERLMMEIGPTLFGHEEGTLGENLQLALWRYLAADNPKELAEMFILLGDPLLTPKIARPMPVPNIDAISTATANPAKLSGFAALPPAFTGKAGSFQFKSYTDSVQPGPLSTYTTGTQRVPFPILKSIDGPASLAVSGSITDIANASENTVVSTIAPHTAMKGLQLLQWNQLGFETTTSKGISTMQFQMRNELPLPMRGVTIEIVDVTSETVLGRSDRIDFAPFADRSIDVQLPCVSGLRPVRAYMTDGVVRTEIETDVPIAVTCLRSDDQRNLVPPVMIDPRTVRTSYRNSGAGVLAGISAQTYILASEPLSNLRVGIVGPAGGIISQSVVNVPPIVPGQGTRISMSIELSSSTVSADYKIRFDPTGLYPELTRFPESKVKIGKTQFPDLVVHSITPSQASPTEGETVFFDVAVANTGLSPVEGVRVLAFVEGSDRVRKPAKSQVFDKPTNLRIDAGTTRTFRLRWDPFKNAGDTKLIMQADSVYSVPDRNPEDNSKAIVLYARTKAILRSVSVGVLPVTKDDVSQRQVRFLAKVRNDGQTAAHGLKVSFYSEKSMSAQSYLGDVEIETLDPGTTGQAVLSYKLKPGEEHRPINITCDVMYKGSRQRIPLD